MIKIVTIGLLVVASMMMVGCGGTDKESFVVSCDIDSEIRYIRDDATGIVTDTDTCLQWEDKNLALKPWITEESAKKGDYSDTSGDTARSHCQKLTLDGGGWRLPSKAELLSATNSSEGNPWIYVGVWGQNSFWSSTVVSGHENHYAWWAVMGAENVRGDNTTNSNLKVNSDSVRCVRSVTALKYEGNGSVH